MTNVLDGISDHPKPADTATWWSKLDKSTLTANLEDEEGTYMDFYTSDEAPSELHIGRGIAKIGNLTEEEKKRAAELFGDLDDSLVRFVNYENRRRIVAHYVWSHPATVQYEIQLYRLTRDAIPPFFIAERVWEVFTGEEAFTGEKVSRIRAGVDLLVAIIIGRVLRAAAGYGVPPRTPAPPLTDPIWDLPPSGGGMRINGRWYTEHALERMAPDTPQIRAEMRTRVANRLAKLGIPEGSAAYDACLARGMQKIDPRGIPPSVVEAEISARGTTNVKVITARRGQVVITVMPKK